jgi:hypothetical protein
MKAGGPDLTFGKDHRYLQTRRPHGRQDPQKAPSLPTFPSSSPSIYELVLNLKPRMRSASRPQSVQVQADEVIE